MGQILDQILDQIFDQVLGQILDQIFDQVLGQILDQKIQCTVLLGQKKGYTLTTIVFLGPTNKMGYPLSTNNIAKRYIFVNDYTIEAPSV